MTSLARSSLVVALTAACASPACAGADAPRSDGAADDASNGPSPYAGPTSIDLDTLSQTFFCWPDASARSVMVVMRPKHPASTEAFPIVIYGRDENDALMLETPRMLGVFGALDGKLGLLFHAPPEQGGDVVTVATDLSVVLGALGAFENQVLGHCVGVGLDTDSTATDQGVYECPSYGFVENSGYKTRTIRLLADGGVVFSDTFTLSASLQAPSDVTLTDDTVESPRGFGRVYGERLFIAINDADGAEVGAVQDATFAANHESLTLHHVDDLGRSSSTAAPGDLGPCTRH